jgi:tetratricopeptide (TPR) repeat protein
LALHPWIHVGGEVLLLALLVGAAYGPALDAGFVTWDDPEYVARNAHVQAHDPARWLEIFDPRTLVVHDWTPLVTVTHIVERNLVGNDPAAYHATNGVLQIACALAAAALFRTLGMPAFLATAAAALYAVHPLQVESVAWIASRKNLLSTLFFLLAAVVYLRRRSPAGWGLSLGLFVLAVMGKATAVMLPAWLAAVHGARRDVPVRTWVLALAPFFAVALARGLYTVVTQSEPVEDTAALGLVGRLAVMGPILATYLRQLFWPADLSLLYPWPDLTFTDPRVLGAWVGLIAIVALVIAGRRDRRLLELSVFVPIALFPTLNLIPAPFLQADRYVHLPLVGAVGVVAVALDRVLGGRTRVASALLIAGALALVPLTRARTEVWQNSERLWRDALASDPGFAPGYSNLAIDLHAEGRSEESIELLEEAVRLEPTRPLWRANLGAILAETGDVDEGRRLLESAVEESPDLADAHGSLAVIALQEGRTDDALEHARSAAALRPGDPRIEVHVPEALARLGKRDEAIEEYRRIARSYPIPEVLLGWADQERLSGRMGGAETLYVRLLEIEPDQPDALYNLGTLRFNQGDTMQALGLYDRLIAVAPNHAAGHNNRGNALLGLGRRLDALAAYRAAVASAPDDPRFKTNLANVLAQSGDCRAALVLYEEALRIDPSSSIARLNHGSCLLQVGRRDEGVRELQALSDEGHFTGRIERILSSSPSGETR